MNITKIIFYDQKELYKIFKELNDFFNLNIQSVTNKNDLKLLIKDSNNFLIITNNLISNFKNQLIIDNKPLKIQKILEKINIEILKNNYSQKSNIKIGNYLLNINSREIFLNK